MTAAKMAGIPKRKMIFLTAKRPTRDNLKRPFRKCTIAVKPMASSMGKKMAKTGVKSVPNPKPEKKVRSEANAATAGMMK